MIKVRECEQVMSIMSQLEIQESGHVFMSLQKTERIEINIQIMYRNKCENISQELTQNLSKSHGEGGSGPEPRATRDYKQSREVCGII